MIAGVPFAGFWSRVGATIVDAIVLFIAYLLLAIVVVLLLAMTGEGGGTLLIGLVNWIAVGVYYVWGWSSWSGGQTLGKRAMNQRVVNEAGLPLSKLRALGRLFAAGLSALPFGLGYLWAAWDPQRQTWHDKIVGSYVVGVDSRPAEISSPTARISPGLRSDRLPCPRCGESIPVSARVCRYCGVEFEAGASASR